MQVALPARVEEPVKAIQPQVAMREQTRSPESPEEPLARNWRRERKKAEQVKKKKEEKRILPQAEDEVVKKEEGRKRREKKNSSEASGRFEGEND